MQRFKTDGFTHLPPMRALGEMWMNDSRGGEGSGAMRATNAATGLWLCVGRQCAPVVLT